ncbi:MAG: ferrous iron transporter B [Elusimicrobia bacterium]|nr:ferrous iron transporter B [Elusimicrobiota bacterium]
MTPAVRAVSPSSAAARRVVALAGRPNTGKTTLFNALTGLRQRVANFAGCTVEKAVGERLVDGHMVEIVDLPGTHALLPDTEDERVAFRFLSECAAERADLLVLCVAEASNLSNDLALAAGVKAAGYRTALVVNMIDEAELNGIRVDASALSQALGMPVATAAAREGVGIDAVAALLAPVGRAADLSRALDFRRTTKTRLRELQDDAVAAAQSACAAAVELPGNALLPTLSRSIRIDRAVLHPVLGPLIFAAAMFFLFQALFAWAQPLMDLLTHALAAASALLRARLPAGPLSSLLCDGAIPGMSAVVVFVPQIAILFALIGALEQTGYLPRAGAMIDRALRPFGLDGRVFIPFLSSFACAIPGVMAARTIPNEKRRLVAVLLAPLMTCSARLPVYALIITAFVPASFRPGGFDGRGVVMAAMYVFGVVMALLLALALKWTRLYEAHPSPVVVLPPYRLPRPRELAHYVWVRCRHFLERAGKVIFAVSLILWAMAAFPRDEKSLRPLEAQQASALAAAPSPQRDALLDQLSRQIASARISGSILGRLGRGVEPAFRPLGWDWRVSVAVMASLAAREVFVGTLGAIYAMGREEGDSAGLIRALRDAKKPDGSPRYGIPTAVGLLIFFAIALQCVSTIAIVRRETGGWKWPAIQFASFFVIAYALSFAAVRLLSVLGA